ncbi:MAG: hypothetical protein EZS28_024737 [Streblomastix strix]|uniref:Uncharacterized protein n=1 Tax=Streblomastix strix TaxID=222440 RepID=A0A5J4VB06_9EUKA|nr:MAG: hypothetical protein EZS28_024737 [Streblomastix strix]
MTEFMKSSSSDCTYFLLFEDIDLFIFVSCSLYVAWGSSDIRGAYCMGQSGIDGIAGVRLMNMHKLKFRVANQSRFTIYARVPYCSMYCCSDFVSISARCLSNARIGCPCALLGFYDLLFG